MRNLFFRLVAVGVFCLITYFMLGKKLEESPIIAMPTAILLNDDELAKLPEQAVRGNCDASIRLGDFYMTQLDTRDQAEKWYRMADSCAKDPRVKEFLIACIIDNKQSDASVREVTRIFHEIEMMDPVRAERMRESVHRFLKQ
jgi:hypothetical protein